MSYNTAARVYHYHYEDADFMYRRTITGLYFNYRTFGTVPQPWKAPRTIKSWLYRFKWTFVKSGLSLTVANNWLRYQKERNQALENGIKAFLDSLNQGNHHLDEFHSQLCGKPPIPGKR